MADLDGLAAGVPERVPQPGEVWEDAEGTLLCGWGPRGGVLEGWWAFGAADPVPLDHPKIVHPLRLVFDEEGWAHLGRLRYPDGNVWSNQ